MLRYILHHDIDRKKWDAGTDNSIRPKIYALSWYLDIINPGWDAIVEDDYDSVMPVTRRKKFGLLYVCQPVFAQQTGIFSKEEAGRKK